MRRSLTLLLAALLGAVSTPVLGGQIPSPEEFLGHKVGEDRTLAHYSQVTEYLRRLDAASERVTVEVAGRSTLGAEILNVVLTSEANSARLDHYREIARRLANPDELAPGQAEELIAEGKAIALITCTIHATEVGSTQMAMELAYDLATTEDPQVLSWLDDAILLLVPSINPDGQKLVIDWYEQYLDTEYEGGPMPWLYHHYVGHDLNRDFFMLTQAETRAINTIVYQRWFPQVFLDEHQMGPSGPRMVVPPQTDPLAPEIHPLIFRQADLLGTAMAVRLEEAGKTGVGSNMIFDSYWPGATRNTAWWKNVTGLLTEVASASIATPIYVDPGELRGGVKGLPDYQRRSNFPSPWAGGWWRLRDIIDYELVASKSYLESVARYRETILANFHRMSREAIEAGQSGPPYAFLIPPDQHDPVVAGKLVDLLLAHGVRVEEARDEFRVGRVHYPAGTWIVPAAQPYRPFLLTMLRPQRYPEVRPHTDGPILAPYDVTTWSLPLLMGVDVEEAGERFQADAERIAHVTWHPAAPSPDGQLPGGARPDGEAPGGWLLSHRDDTVPIAINRLLAENKEVYWLTEALAGGKIGDVYLPASTISADRLRALVEELHLNATPLPEAPRGPAWRLAPVKVGLYKPWVASMDEGWTRFLLEGYSFPYVNLENDRMKAGDYARDVDVILFPDVTGEVIAQGESPSRPGRPRAPFPPPYAGGIGKEGGEHLKRWVSEGGGTVVAMDSSTRYLIELFELPVADALAGRSEGRVNAPGSMLRILLDPTHPLSWGLRAEEAAYFANSPAFATTLPDARFGRRVVARYPEAREDVLVSGYLDGAEQLARRAAVVELTVGKGRIILFGFRPQHRAQPHRTFKMLFNALFWAGSKEVDL